MIFVYCVTFLGVLHNTIKYLMIQSKWRLFLISMTYSLFFLILGSRIASLSLFLRFYLSDLKSDTFAANELDTVAAYISLVLGICQCGSMIKLIWWVKIIRWDKGQSNLHILEKLLATQVVKLHKLCSIFSATVIGIMIYFLIDLHRTECLKNGLVEPKC